MTDQISKQIVINEIVHQKTFLKLKIKRLEKFGFDDRYTKAEIIYLQRMIDILEHLIKFTKNGNGIEEEELWP
jgi:hypothetical protein